MKPLIGITTGEIINHKQPWDTPVYGQKKTYSDAVIAAGGVPLFIPFMPEEELKQLYSRIDGVLFAGGEDINPNLYGETQRPLTVDVSNARDGVESALMKWTLADNKPLFSICRGYQMLNVQLGGTLYQDLSTEFEGASNHHISTDNHDYTHIAHHLKVAPNSRLAAIIQHSSLKANTHHHQGVKELAPQLQAVAWSEDGLIEAIEHPFKPFVLGVQCHPESLAPLDESWARLFKAFVDEAQKQIIPSRLFKLKQQANKLSKRTFFRAKTSSRL